MPRARRRALGLPRRREGQPRAGLRVTATAARSLRKFALPASGPVVRTPSGSSSQGGSRDGSAHDAGGCRIEQFQVREVCSVDPLIAREQPASVRHGMRADQKSGEEMLPDRDSRLALRTHRFGPRAALTALEPTVSPPTIGLKGPPSALEAHRTCGLAADACLLQKPVEPVALEVRGQFRVDDIADDKASGTCTPLQGPLSHCAEG